MSNLSYSYLLGKSYKIEKSDKYTEYENFIMYLAPSDASGVNVCPNASPGCIASCLNTAGRGAFNGVQSARMARTMHYIKDRIDFIFNLRSEILKYSKKYKKLAIRLNGTSDINWNSFINGMYKTNPNIQFYDYTKNPLQALKSLNMPNYSVTFSRSEINDSTCLDMLKAGINVAVVFRNKLPKTWNGYKVIDGDITDTRFLDDQGIVVGLLAKGKAKKDKTGFVVDCD